jgi:Mg2+-importing ATPase
MSFNGFAQQGALEVVSLFKSNSTKGLGANAVSRGLKKYGPNHLDLTPLSWTAIFWRQFVSPFIYMLIAASLLSFFLQQWLEGVIILFFLLLNTALGFFQEFKSEKTVNLLGKLIAWKQRVLRVGKLQEVDSAELVPGDIIILETGDRISADARLIEVSDLSVDESSLTGESIPVDKHHKKISKKVSDVSGAINMVFSGTSVISGKAKAVVVATGQASVIGKIAELSTNTKKTSNFADSVSGLSKHIVKLVIVTLVFVLILNIIIKGETNLIELLIFSIALAIGVIPEALPLVMTFTFSKGAMTLAKRQVIVKRLSSIEDLGNIEVLCSDKTGTLTEGELRVFDTYFQKGDAETVISEALLSSGEKAERTDVFDIALERVITKKITSQLNKDTVLSSIPFDPKFLRNSALVKNELGRSRIIVRGAPEIILSLSNKLSAEQRTSAECWVSEQGRLGRRVLAVASRQLKDIKLIGLKHNLREQEKNLEFLGMISFADDIRSSALAAIKQARDLDVKIKIITGDSREVAGAVAYKINLISDPSLVITGDELEKMSPEELEAAVLKYSVFARISPDKKYDIIKSLQKKFHVGYLGDGINDAPALKLAGVSLAVNNAADIAREAADVILLESDLRVIIEGIKEGRKIFINSTKYIKATLASNFGNFYAIAVASLLIPFLPMLPLQLLLLNLLSDFPMISIATDNVDKEELLTPKHYQTKDILIVAMILGILSTIFDFVFFALFKNISPGVLQTNWFIASILTELAFLFSIRTKRLFFLGCRPSTTIFLLSGLAASATLTIPFLSWGQKIFGFIAPEPKHLIWIFSLIILYVIFSEIIKLTYYRTNKQAE